MLAVQLLYPLICISPLSVLGAPLWPVPTTQSLGTGVLWLPDKLPFTVAGRNSVSTTGFSLDLPMTMMLTILIDAGILESERYRSHHYH